MVWRVISITLPPCQKSNHAFSEFLSPNITSLADLLFKGFLYAFRGCPFFAYPFAFSIFFRLVNFFFEDESVFTCIQLKGLHFTVLIQCQQALFHYLYFSFTSFFPPSSLTCIHFSPSLRLYSSLGFHKEWVRCACVFVFVYICVYLCVYGWMCVCGCMGVWVCM